MSDPLVTVSDAAALGLINSCTRCWLGTDPGPAGCDLCADLSEERAVRMREALKRQVAGAINLTVLAAKRKLGI